MCQAFADRMDRCSALRRRLPVRRREAGALARASEPGRQADTDCAGRTGRDIGIAVRVREISFVGNVLEIPLQADVLSERDVQRGIRTKVTRQRDAIVDRRKHVRATD